MVEKMDGMTLRRTRSLNVPCAAPSAIGERIAGGEGLDCFTRQQTASSCVRRVRGADLITYIPAEASLLLGRRVALACAMKRMQNCRSQKDHPDCLPSVGRDGAHQPFHTTRTQYIVQLGISNTRESSLEQSSYVHSYRSVHPRFPLRRHHHPLTPCLPATPSPGSATPTRGPC